MFIGTIDLRGLRVFHAYAKEETETQRGISGRR